MSEFHADDPMGAAAHAAAIWADHLPGRLHIAASPLASREERAAALQKVFTQWPKLAEAMANLEATAPNAALAGQSLHHQVRDYIEARDAA